MKFSLSWLKDHLDTDASAEAIADKLTAIGLEVEELSNPAVQDQVDNRRCAQEHRVLLRPYGSGREGSEAQSEPHLVLPIARLQTVDGEQHERQSRKFEHYIRADPQRFRQAEERNRR